MKSKQNAWRLVMTALSLWLFCSLTTRYNDQITSFFDSVQMNEERPEEEGLLQQQAREPQNPKIANLLGHFYERHIPYQRGATRRSSPGKRWRSTKSGIEPTRKIGMATTQT